MSCPPCEAANDPVSRVPATGTKARLHFRTQALDRYAVVEMSRDGLRLTEVVSSR
jgi:hypothetical protein